MRTRSEKEMYDLLNAFVGDDDRIRLAIINGSRANPRVKKDIFQDYDIACYVTDVSPYLEEVNVVPYFGDAIIVEQPNYGPWPPDDADGSYHNYNIQLLDGNRIDLSFFPLTDLDENCKDSLSTVFVDKDGLCENLPPASEASYYIGKPNKELYRGCCDAFFFAIGSHIPKTIWRQQLPQLKAYTEGWLRVPLRLMLSWEIAITSGYDTNIGVNGRYLEDLLSAERWQQYKSTYVDGDIDNIWQSLYVFYDLFTDASKAVAKEHGYVYPEEKARKVLAFLQHVQALDKDAQRIYDE